MMDTDTFVDWENKFMDAGHGFPPGRDIPAALADSAVRATSLQLYAWIAGQQQAEIERLRASSDEAAEAAEKGGE